MKKKLIIEFDDEKIDELMAVQAIKGFELDWVKEIRIEETN